MFIETERLWMVVVFAAAFSFEGYIRIQFTKTAGIACAAGGILLIYALSQKKTAWMYYTAGLVLMMTGSMYRYNQFQCELAMFLGLALYLFLTLMSVHDKGENGVQAADGPDDIDIIPDKKAAMRRLALCVFTAGLVLLLGTGLRQIHKMAYSSEEWQEYQEYNLARARLQDYGMPDYDKYEEEYNALGLDRTAYRLFKKWTNADSEKITTEVMQNLLTLQKPTDVFSRKFVNKYFKTILPGILRINTFWVFAAFVLVWLVEGKKGKKEYLCLLLEILLVMLMYFYFLYLGRFLRNRVDVGIWMIMAMTVMWMIGGKKSRIPRAACMVFMIAGIAATAFLSRTFLRVNQQATMASFEKRRAVVEAIHEDKDHLYLAKTNTITLAMAYGVWDVIPFGIFENMYSLGGWGVNTPVNQTLLEKWGVENPMRDMIDNDKIYLVDKDIELTERYLQIWYNEKARAVRIKNKKLSPFKVWQIRTDADKE